MILLMFTRSPLRLLSVLLYYAILASACQLLVGAEACTLLVAAASDISPLQDDLKGQLGSKAKCEVRFTFGSSGQLAQQIANGAPYDLFLSASADFLNGLKVLDQRVYAQGRLALWSKK